MVALKLQNFGAMLPAVDPRLLPQQNAEVSQNTWLYSGALEGLPRMVPIRTLADPTAKKAFRIPFDRFSKDNITDSYWIELPTTYADIVPSPTVGDTFERYYWTGVGITPQYNTKARIASGAPAYKLGIPSSSTPPGITVTGGTSPSDPGYIAESRTYVYTWVSTFGEEGPPSPPATAVGASNGAWSITVTAPSAEVLEGRTLSHVKIYRTITASVGSTAYYYVAQIGILSTVYVDAVSTVTVAGNNLLQSLFWVAPPSDLEGMVAMPNGIIAGFRANEVWFSEPYRPHAWPPIYTLALAGEIVGLGVIGQSLVACTRVSPYVISGVNPASMAVSKIATNEPCLSRGSVVSTPNGVVFASSNGLVLAAPGISRNVTDKLITKNFWLDAMKFLNVPTINAALFKDAYYCWGAPVEGSFGNDAFDENSFELFDFTGADLGAIIDIGDPRMGYTRLYHPEATDNCWNDDWTGEVFTIRDGVVYWLDLDSSRAREPFKWRSKILETPNQRNFGAMRVFFETYPDSPVLNPVPNAGLEQQLAADQWGLVRVYADGILRFTRELRTSGQTFRLPSGFKATFWQVEIEARVKVLSVEIATTTKELGSV
jgi:hypothetical protein